jgi:hypothetical protein
MRIPKPSPGDVARFRALVPDDPRVEVKPMFGNLGAFVNGNMFLGLFGSDIGLRLAAGDAEALRAIPGSGPFGPAERPMGGYVALPPGFYGTPDAQAWVRRSLDHVGALPPKEGKAPTRAKAPSRAKAPKATTR